MFNFQEIVELNPVNVAFSSSAMESAIAVLEDDLERSLKERYSSQAHISYKKMRSINMVGLYTVIYVREELCSKLSKIEAHEKPSTLASLGGTSGMGNKGCVVVRFNL